MRRIRKHLQGGNSIGFERAVEDEEAGKMKAAFNPITRHFVDL
jgi:hypothetical protein